MLFPLFVIICYHLLRSKICGCFCVPCGDYLLSLQRMRKMNYDISRQMQDDLIKAYCKACESSWTMLDACNKAVKMPAPRFYITPKQAHAVISRMMKGDFGRVDLFMPLKRKMYYELFDVVVRLSEKREFIGKSLWYIMPYAVLQPASQFFIKGHSLYCIRQDMRMGRIAENGKQRDRKVGKGARR